MKMKNGFTCTTCTVAPHQFRKTHHKWSIGLEDITICYHLTSLGEKSEFKHSLMIQVVHHSLFLMVK